MNNNDLRVGEGNNTIYSDIMIVTNYVRYNTIFTPPGCLSCCERADMARTP